MKDVSQHSSPSEQPLDNSVSDLLPSTVYIVDDDPDMRTSLEFLFRSMGIVAKGFSSANAFLAEYRSEMPGCLVCDVRMPDLSGFDLTAKLTAAGAVIPVIYMTAYADVPMAIRALKSGAHEFIEKPFNAQSMLEKVQRAIQADRYRRIMMAQWQSFSIRLQSLTGKEQEALKMILEGVPNKVMAARLSISERAVEMRRASIMHKLNTSTVAELIRLVTQFEAWQSSQKTNP